MYRFRDISFVNLHRQRERPLANSLFVYVNKLVIVILLHLWKNIFGTSRGRAVCYASRSLIQVERRYSQTEKEALAFILGV